jgi:hypothetical protein
MAHSAGESKPECVRVDFDRRLKLEFHGPKITSDAGLLVFRELDDALGLTKVAGEVFQDSRTGKNGWHGMVGQFRQSVFGRLGGYKCKDLCLAPAVLFVPLLGCQISEACNVLCDGRMAW